ncbi:isoprenyl transferase [Oceanobacillus alkalisoli]|uniref:isoprenyl transferase n=1 Tax=Oceanobacillus alkalisoli TaxID=2925113 RepID=UPI001EEF946C|nr:isoprenyl transferase [Oceanobacillus alkalisoli]MCF3944297.1 isoprenyl transferase [Oceanobacillus alkalisoli]MCG5104908.1 isoprenyl transferase [Oceanobacillus alkalisoli]
MVDIPKHVGIIMDGNGRWGKSRGLTRSQGHYAGVQAMEKAIDASIGLGVEALTLYAFSSENWARTKEEVNYLMRLPIRFFKSKLPEFMRRNVKITISGNMDELPKATRKTLQQSMDQTKNNTGLIVNFAFNYGGRGEIVQAVQHVIRDMQEKNIELDEETIEDYLYTGGLPALDLVIRTGGEQRLSNFLLWQAAHAELYFTDIYFPDFDEAEMQAAIYEFQERRAVYDFTEMYRKAK